MVRVIEEKVFQSIRLIQSSSAKSLYIAGIDAKTIRNQANISRLNYNVNTNQFEGYQREIDNKHKAEILEYLRKGMSKCGPIMTDAITVALKEKVIDSNGKEFMPRFETSEPEAEINFGHLILPFIYEQNGSQKDDLKDNDESLCWVVDGQHRLEAFLDYDYTGVFALPFTFYISSDVNFNREVFIRTNIRLPIKKDIMLRDLARITGAISNSMAIDQLVGQVAEKLEFEVPNSPFRDKIKKEKKSKGKKKPETGSKIQLSVFHNLISIAVTSDPTLTKLWRRQAPLETPATNIDQIARYIAQYWSAVKKTFPEYWDRPTTEQRLTHSLGLYILSKLMEEVMSDIVDWAAPGAEKQIISRLVKLKRIPWDDAELLKLQLAGSDKQKLFDAIHDFYVTDKPQDEIEIDYALGPKNPKIKLISKPLITA